MQKNNEDLSMLTELDTYSLILFVLFKLRNVAEYASLSELVYILDKDSLLKLCEYFGGMTLKIPTIAELESLVYSLVLYNYVQLENKNYDEVVTSISHKVSDIKKVKSDYKKICKLLSSYRFNHRT